MYQIYRVIIISIACCFLSSCSGNTASFREKLKFDSRHSLYPILKNATDYRVFYGQRGFVQGNSLLVRIEIKECKKFIKEFFNLEFEDVSSKETLRMDFFMEEHFKLDSYLRDSGEFWIPNSFIPIALYYSETTSEGIEFLLGKATDENEEKSFFIFFEK